MRCIEVKENLSLFLDDEIDLSAKENIETHLENCVPCGAEFETLRTISESLKQTLPIATNALFDEKMLNAFESFHAEKQTVKEEKKKSIGWFGIPKLAFATGFILLALVGGLAFQLGKISASNVEISTPANNEHIQKLPNENVEKATIAQNNSDEKVDEKPPEIKIDEVPVIKEKIVEVPVIKEKIVTKFIYKERKITQSEGTILTKEDKSNETFAQNNIRNFQIVSELKPKIIKAGENNED